MVASSIFPFFGIDFYFYHSNVQSHLKHTCIRTYIHYALYIYSSMFEWNNSYSILLYCIISNWLCRINDTLQHNMHTVYTDASFFYTIKLSGPKRVDWKKGDFQTWYNKHTTAFIHTKNKIKWNHLIWIKTPLLVFVFSRKK